MKLIKQSVELIPQNDLFEHIERCARVCYKSEDKQSEHSREFVNKLIANKHLAMLEHGTIYLKIPITTNHSGFSEIHYIDKPYSIVTETEGLSQRDEFGDSCDCWCITTNYRVIKENGWEDDLEYLCKPTEYHEKRYTVKIITSIGIVRELLRHRKFSFANESTRQWRH